MPKTVYLVRHPETTVDPRLPSTDWVLSGQGVRQLESLLALRFWRAARHVFTSTELKTVVVGESAQYRFGAPHTQHAELAELRRSMLLPQEEFLDRMRKVFEHRSEPADGWESAASGLRRIKVFLLETVARVQPPTVVVSHGVVLSLLRADLLGRPRVEFDDWRALPFGAVAKIDVEKWTLIRDFMPPKA
jgi:broad specificity phosphatase PhoE